MGFFDTVKQQARELKGRVKQKVKKIQARRTAAHDLEQLGRFLFAERTDRAVAEADAEIDRIVGELKEIESAGVKILAE
ncbi:MAG TPA: hypothetical protein VE466_06825 [Acidimicrobiales bacterium]|jgi:hypothetical protein|nr:hypothetical protein [Acidimicrobiales bacterium]